MAEKREQAKGGSAETAGRNEINRIIYESRYYQQQAETMQQQLLALDSTLAEVNATVETLKNMQRVKERETMVPIGSGAYLSAVLKNEDKAIINIGAGVLAEKSIPDAVEFLSEKARNTEQVKMRLQNVLKDVVNRVDSLEKEAQAIASKMQG
ncbi:MAG: prefoldin subunit alpha [Candidatus Micrarchaeota archaeon]